MTKRIGIFGGSFNPPHFSHKAIIDACLNKDLVDEVWVLPVYNHTQKDNLISFKHRMKMCRLMFTKWFYPVKVLDLERNNPSGKMIDMMDLLHSLYHNYKFYMIIGQDCANDISTWFNYKHLIEHESFIVFARDHYQTQEPKDWYYTNPRHKFLNIDDTWCSSSVIRKMIQTTGGYNLVESVTNHKVSKYIQKERLYAN